MCLHLSVSHSVYKVVCMVVCVWQGMCMVGGAYMAGVCMAGACVAGGMHGREHAW